MKILYVVFVLVLGGIGEVVNAQAPSWQWGMSAIGAGYGTGIGSDINGNVYVAGTSGPVVSFGMDTLNNSGLNNGVTMFLVKYDPSGNVLWAKNAIGDDEAGGMSVDVNGNVYITGSFDSRTITFGNITIDSGDAFIVKYDPSGKVIWARSGGGAAVSTDRSGNVYLFGNGNLPGEDLLVVKYDSSGNFIWTKGAIGNAGEWYNSISTDASNNIYITGDFEGPILVFGDDTLWKGPDSGYTSIFVVKYNSSGNIIWAKSISTFDGQSNVNTDVFGNLYLSGLG